MADITRKRAQFPIPTSMSYPGNVQDQEAQSIIAQLQGTVRAQQAQIEDLFRQVAPGAPVDDAHVDAKVNNMAPAVKVDDPLCIRTLTKARLDAMIIMNTFDAYGNVIDFTPSRPRFGYVIDDRTYWKLGTEVESGVLVAKWLPVGGGTEMVEYELFPAIPGAPQWIFCKGQPWCANGSGVYVTADTYWAPGTKFSNESGTPGT